MRSKLTVLAAITVLAASFLFVNVSVHPVTSVNAQAVKCTDAKFLTQVATDFTDISKIQATDAVASAHSLLIIAGVRQKYEDMTDVPDTCLSVQYQTVSFMANLSDLFSLAIASQVDAAGAADYAKAATAQVERVKKLGAAMTDLIKNGEGDMAATPAS
ncbi:MAG: hypothetical protein ABI947_09455 [Chloroflexota bacterium]